MRIGIYGLGIVGGSLAKYLEKNSRQVLKKDPALGFKDVFQPRLDAIFICVPVPTKGFKQDLSIVNDILEDWRGSDIPIFIRSTVLPGTADRLAAQFNANVISCPEFLTERSAYQDTEKLPVIYGKTGFRIIPKLFPDHHRHAMTNTECEMAKYAHNCFGALKVTFFNGIHDHCQRLGLNYDDVLRGALSSGHINRTHTLVPGPDGLKGYGGKCFPKDMEAFVGFLKSDILGKMLLDTHCMNRFYRELKSAEYLPKGELNL